MDGIGVQFTKLYAKTRTDWPLWQTILDYFLVSGAKLGLGLGKRGGKCDDLDG
jgi:hypothetical protein